VVVRVRDAAPGDLDALVRFNLAMARETEGLQIDAERLRAGIGAALSDPAKGRYWIAECDGAVVGGVLVTHEWSDWRNAMFWWIQSVYVDPAHRGRGVFTALYRHVERVATAAGCCGLRLYVHEHNERARAVYYKLGMVSSGYQVLETPDPLKK